MYLWKTSRGSRGLSGKVSVGPCPVSLKYTGYAGFQPRTGVNPSVTVLDLDPANLVPRQQRQKPAVLVRAHVLAVRVRRAWIADDLDRLVRLAFVDRGARAAAAPALWRTHPRAAGPELA